MGSRRRIALGVVAGLVLCVSAVGSAAGSAVTLRAVPYPSLGSSILVDGSGRPLYHLMTEKARTIRCTGSCATTWPPVILARGAATGVGSGVNGQKVGTVLRPDGRRQVTYGGFALYRYAGDAKGVAKGQGVGKSWYVLAPSGKVVTRKATTPGASGSTPPPATTTPEAPPSQGTVPGYRY